MCGGAAAGIDERQPLDQVLVDRQRSRLHNKDILWAYRVEQLHCQPHLLSHPFAATLCNPGGGCPAARGGQRVRRRWVMWGAVAS